MRNIIDLGSASLFAYNMDEWSIFHDRTKPILLVVPNVAGYFSSDKLGTRAQRYDDLCEKLSEHCNVFLINLSGQDPNKKEGRFSFFDGYTDIMKTILFIEEFHGPINCIFAMCGGPSMVIKALQVLNISRIKLMLYNAPAIIRWMEERTMEWFETTYPEVKLDKKRLINAPLPSEMLKIFKGNAYVVCGYNSKYDPSNLQDAYLILKDNQNATVEFRAYKYLEDVPGKEQTMYDLLIDTILRFVRVK